MTELSNIIDVKKLQFTVKITPEQRDLMRQNKGDGTNEEFFANMLDCFLNSQLDHLTPQQHEFFKQFPECTERQHVALAVDDYIRRLLTRKARKEQTQEPGRREAAQLKAETLVHTLLKENEAVESPEKRVYINLSLVKKKSEGRINQAVLERVLFLLKDTIDEHHAKFEINPNQNRPRRHL